jgi:hypothetical protein
LGTPALRSNTINLHELGLQRFDLKQLEQRFTEEEVWGHKITFTEQGAGPAGRLVHHPS